MEKKKFREKAKFFMVVSGLASSVGKPYMASAVVGTTGGAFGALFHQVRQLENIKFAVMPSPSSTSTSTPAPNPQQTEEARTAFTASLLSTGTSTVQHDLQTRASDLHSNSLAVSRQEHDVAGATKDLAHEGDRWQKVLENGAKGVKETGDVQNWAEMLERDLCVLEEVVDIVEESKGTEGGRK
ncbi:MAG: hypothetical protein LQ342_006347 [Letrouitia transgressa]|nr:MAG: hypothetical protein LQ342_006347 [Letrouitia transgressa]